MNRKIFCLVLCVLLSTLWVSAEAQQPKEVPRIGWLGAGSSPSQLPRTEAFRRGLRELGYVEEKNIVIDIDMRRRNTIASPCWRRS